MQHAPAASSSGAPEPPLSRLLHKAGDSEACRHEVSRAQAARLTHTVAVTAPHLVSDLSWHLAHASRQLKCSTKCGAVAAAAQGSCSC